MRFKKSQCKIIITHLVLLQNCITHGKEFEKTDFLEFEWKAPNISVGDLIFSATVVKSFEEFWVNNSVLLRAAVQVNSNNSIEPPQVKLFK